MRKITDSPPVYEWLARTGRDAEWLTSELRKAGNPTQIRYLRMVINGYYPPGVRLAMALERICGISVHELLSFEYRGRQSVSKSVVKRKRAS